jgi:hypothetical protein
MLHSISTTEYTSIALRSFGTPQPVKRFYDRDEVYNTRDMK